MKKEPKLTSVSLEDIIDPVNKPIHYNQAGIECIQAIEAMTENMSGHTAPHAANVLKYLWRHEYKNGLEDIDKAIWYLNRLRQRYTEKHK
tara:strand:- start:182 stop:451 length:270 start_codon:yes stop_codon:yes gene_type:complete